MEEVTVRKMSQFREGRRGRLFSHDGGIPVNDRTVRMPPGGLGAVDGVPSEPGALMPAVFNSQVFFEGLATRNIPGT
jgi:hypothetical protein